MRKSKGDHIYLPNTKKSLKKKKRQRNIKQRMFT